MVVTDVKGSTQSIETGRYKDVNTIGAASIAVVSGLLGRDFPYIFGGDGATLLAPSQAIDLVLDGLKRLQRLAREQFQIELRVGRIAVGEVLASGRTIEVAKHELASGKCTAVFRGGGLSEAEKRVKGDEAKYCCDAGATGDGAHLDTATAMGRAKLLLCPDFSTTVRPDASGRRSKNAASLVLPGV